MSGSIVAAAVALIFVTSFISGVFGMAGGFILLGALLLVLPVTTTMVVHGIVQFASNFSRMVILRRHIDWRIISTTTLGTAAAVGLLVISRYLPDKRTIFVVLGLVPMLVWIPQRWLRLDASRPVHGFCAGFASGAFNVGAGVAGPLVDIFFVRTEMDRRTIVGTKSTIQSIAHVCKSVYYGSLGTALDSSLLILLALAIPATVIAANLGARVLERLSDARFREYARYIVTAVGGVFLWRALTM